MHRLFKWSKPGGTKKTPAPAPEETPAPVPEVKRDPKKKATPPKDSESE